jgi:hypothetical protein
VMQGNSKHWLLQQCYFYHWLLFQDDCSNGLQMQRYSRDWLLLHCYCWTN